MRLLDDLNQGLADLAAQGLTRRRKTIETGCAAHMRVDGREIVGFASNDYLGLASHPALAGAIAEGAAKFGAGSGGSHLLGGHSDAHAQLEQQLAAFCGGFVDGARALYFSTGYMANLAVMSALSAAGARIYSDRLNHASLIDGARLSRAEVRIYPHGDAAALDALIGADDVADTPAPAHIGNAAPVRTADGRTSFTMNAGTRGSSARASVKLISTDSVFSMDGDIAPLAALLEVAQRHEAWLVVDDAHGFGVLGEQGRGALAAAGLRSEHLIYVGTLGKAAGVAGAFVVAHPTVIEWLIQRARTYIFTTAAPPAVAHAVSVSLKLIAGAEGDRRRAHLSHLIARTRTILAGTRWQPVDSHTAVQPLIIGTNEATLALAAALDEQGLWVPAIRPPTVPAGTSRLRISLSAGHSDDDLDRLERGLRSAGPTVRAA
ncbi:8-amino-7-oxononanoate synthase [Pararobbsia alpina]|uniref:8-amino-7-oxononanoate synthase n=1 Tax=Pararobbsia alpina TaxID=621374 RepID=A0A6S7B5N1_9BURK|nr:8-amino-7-oxononanoate synthase [Pararobbsia alpina]CAB3788917.1 8-amino-7-oxononanoate synthase [Pararobbsia alpina]